MKAFEWGKGCTGPKKKVVTASTGMVNAKE